MNEGYLIVNCVKSNLTQVELLIKSIRFFDKERPISIVTNEPDLVKYLLYVDNDIFLDPETVFNNDTALYFQSLLKSPYEKTIAFLPDQILTNFNPEVWENLRGMNSIVIPKTRSNFNGEQLPNSVYYHSAIEEKSFGEGSILNAIFYNKNKGCDYALGMAVLISIYYNQNEYIDFFSEFENNAMPAFPEYIWPGWIISLIGKILSFKLSKFDFIDCIDLSLRENSYINDQWSKKPWSEFLSYWVNESGNIKIENYIQSGLIKYNTNAWLTENTLTNLRKKFI